MKEATLITPSPQDGQADLFQGMSPSERADNLEALAHVVEEEPYMRPLSEQELTSRKNTLVDNSVTLNLLAEEKKAVTAEINGKATRLSKENKTLLDDITHQAVKEHGKVYSILSDDNRWVDKYNESGTWLSRRRAGPEDSQRHINMRPAY
jgi:small-conductance mechanosensitive channel